jgi:hypothetical protein
MPKISEAELAEWNSSEKLAEAIEARLILDLLDSDPHLIKTRPFVNRLTSMLAAWRDWSNPTRDIAREMGYKSLLGEKYRNNGETRVFEDNDRPAYTNEDMEWLDAKIQALDLPERAVIVQETRYKDKRDHRAVWLNKCRDAGYTGLLLRSYTAILRGARESLIMAMLDKYK